jgi:serine/threonine protein kinase
MKVSGRDPARYQILEHLATGGMAEVYKAKLIQPNGFSKIVVIKKIISPYESDRRWIDSFLREAKIMSLLSHSNIAHVYHLGEPVFIKRRKFGGKYFLVMEFVDGGSLYRLKKEAKKIPLEFVYYMALEILKGLSYAHKKGVLHRDLSPSNILISKEGEVKISDFGIAQLRDSKASFAGGIIRAGGKPDYMSPEQKEGCQLTESSDLYSLALILYEMMTGEKYGKDLSGRNETLKKALANSGEDRFPTAELFEEALKQEWGAAIKSSGISQREFSKFLSNYPPWDKYETEALSGPPFGIRPSPSMDKHFGGKHFSRSFEPPKDNFFNLGRNKQKFSLFLPLFVIGFFIPLGLRSADFFTHGFLMANIRPWANVYFENKTSPVFLGMTPLVHRMMPTGKYRLMFVNRDLKKTKVVAVDIGANEILTLALKF